MNTREEFHTNSYLVLEKYIDPILASELGDGFRRFVNTNRDLAVLDEQAPTSPAVYDYLPFVRLMVEKNGEVSKLIGEPVLPTYAYARIYTTGADLKRHTDREACEVSLTINLYKDRNWPIWFETPDGKTVGVDLDPGDAVLYRGCIAPHWRDVFEGDQYIQVFTHYVKAYGKNAWAYFDKKKD